MWDPHFSPVFPSPCTGTPTTSEAPAGPTTPPAEEVLSPFQDDRTPSPSNSQSRVDSPFGDHSSSLPEADQRPLPAPRSLQQCYCFQRNTPKGKAPLKDLG